MVNLSQHDDKLQTLSTLGSWHTNLSVAKSINYKPILQPGITTRIDLPQEVSKFVCRCQVQRDCNPENSSFKMYIL